MESRQTINKPFLISSIVVLLLWVLLFVSGWVLDEGDHWVGQIDRRLMFWAPVLTWFYSAWLVWRGFKKGRWWRIVLASLGGVVWLCLFYVFVIFMGFVGSLADKCVERDGSYVLRYERSSEFFSPGEFTLYRRQGLVEHRQCELGDGWGVPDTVSLTVDEEHDLVVLETHYRGFDNFDRDKLRVQRLSSGDFLSEEDCRRLVEDGIIPAARYDNFTPQSDSLSVQVPGSHN